MIYSRWINDNLTDFYINGGFEMRKIYRLCIATIALIGALMMGMQHDYLVMVLMIILAIVFVSRVISNDISKI